MASKNFTGYLRDPLSEFATQDLWTFTHLTTTGETVKGSVSRLRIPDDGLYNIDIQYGNVNIISKDTLNTNSINHGTYTINSETIATTLPSLLNSTIPTTTPEILAMEALLQDAQDAADAAAASAASIDLINDLSQAYIFDTVALLKTSAIVFPVGKTIDRYYYEKGDAGYAEGIVKTATQAATDGDVIDGYYNVTLANGNVWIIVTTLGITLEQGGYSFDGSVLDENIREAYDALASNRIVNREVLRGGKNGGTTLVDMHYGVMRGRGYTDGQGNGDNTLVSEALAGQRVVQLTTSGSALVVGQLVSYLAEDGEYYSSSIDSITGSGTLTVTLNSDIEVSIPAGVDRFFTFMSDVGHPRPRGYDAITDYALREAKVAYKVVQRADLALYNGASSLANTAYSYDNCGSVDVPAIDLTMPIANTDGLRVDIGLAETGAYIARFVINSNNNDVKLGWIAGSYSGSVDVNTNECRSYDVKFVNPTANSTIIFTVLSQDAGAVINIKPEILLMQPSALTPNLAKGKHVLLGDSWFAQTGIYERLLVRHPDATIVNAGVGGNTAAGLISRFDSDVTPEKPDVVWIMVGTNDYAQGVAPELFNFYVNQLVGKCWEIGAHVVVFSPSVGALPSAEANFNRSRLYTDLTTYQTETAEVTGAVETVTVTYTIPPTVVPNGDTPQLLNFGTFEDEFTLDEYYLTGCDFTVGEKGNLSAAQVSTTTLNVDTYTTADVTHSYTGNRFIDIRPNNTSGSDVTVYGYVKVKFPVEG